MSCASFWGRGGNRESRAEGIVRGILWGASSIFWGTSPGRGRQWHTLHGSGAATVREQTCLSMVQAGGGYRKAGLESLSQLLQAEAPSLFLRYALHPRNKAVHFFRVLDATSRRHFLGARP